MYHMSRLPRNGPIHLSPACRLVVRIKKALSSASELSGRGLFVAASGKSHPGQASGKFKDTVTLLRPFSSFHSTSAHSPLAATPSCNRASADRCN